MANSVMENLSEPILEHNMRVHAELERLYGSALSVEDYEDGNISQEMMDRAFITVYTTNPDGTLKEGIEIGSSSEVVEALRREYGDRIPEAEYKMIGKRFDQAGLNNKFRGYMLEGAIWATMPGLRETPIGQHFRKKIKSIIEQDLERR